jgi:hypothetical protein
METKIKTLNDKHQKLEEKFSHLTSPVHKEEEETTNPPALSPTSEEITYNIPTSNSYETLNHHNEPETTPEKSNNTDEHTSHESEETTQKPETPQSSQTPQHTPPATTEHPINHQTIILCDSNGRFLQPNILCPDSTTKYIRCPTLSKAQEILNDETLPNPNTLIIHTGTNDLEHQKSNHHLLLKYKEILKTIKEKYPNCRILISSLLPRKDTLNQRAHDINNNLQEIVGKSPNTVLVEHKNIHKDDLHDKKHLNQHGVKIFAMNIKASYYNTTPKRTPRRKPYHPSNNSGPPFTRPNYYPPPFTNTPRTSLPSYPFPQFTHPNKKTPPMPHLNLTSKKQPPFNTNFQTPFPPSQPFTHLTHNPPTYADQLKKNEPLHHNPPQHPPIPSHSTSKPTENHGSNYTRSLQEPPNLPRQLIDLIQQLYGYI